MAKTIFFDIDDTLYPSTELAYHARKNAINAMIDAGLKGEAEKIFKTLEGIVQKYGSNYPQHFDKLLGEIGVPWSPAIVAAGVAAYHDTKLSYIKPYPETVPVLLQLRDNGYKLGIITDGLAVKQWEKLIRLGLQHFFHAVIVSETSGFSKPSAELFKIALESMNCRPDDAVMVGDKPEKDIAGAKSAGLKTIWIKKKPFAGEVKADFVIENLVELPGILEKLR